MGKTMMRLAALAAIGFAVYRGLKMIGVLGGDEAVEFEWAED